MASRHAHHLQRVGRTARSAWPLRPITMKAEVSPSTNRCWLRAPFNFSGELKALKNLSGTGFATTCGGDLHHRSDLEPEGMGTPALQIARGRPPAFDRSRQLVWQKLGGDQDSIGGQGISLTLRTERAPWSHRLSELASLFVARPAASSHLNGPLGVGNSMTDFLVMPARRARRFRLRGHRLCR
jgi:hypothetical protein